MHNFSNYPERMWINQPSTLQPLHALNGTNVLAMHDYGDTMRIYFLSGPVVSQQAPRLSLSLGWLTKEPTMTPTQAAHVKAAALKAAEASAEAMRAALQDSDPAAAHQANRDAHAFLNKAIDLLTEPT